ncbi:MAG: aldo/keto reductase [Eubacteriaceae bacterium]|nr:aldo/keto reductase [Eubacteriaceae bacterium]
MLFTFSKQHLPGLFALEKTARVVGLHKWYNENIMIYKNEISRLGFGCMRLPKDLEKTENMIMHALDSGINYFDTAYIYSGNEELLGKIIERNDCRDRMKIATKIPNYMLKKPEDFDKYFDTQLKRLRTDHIDYYLMHMLPDVGTWDRLVDLGITDWIERKKNSGAIGHIGFSYHGGNKNFMELIDAYDWEFAQVQYNYMDENSQAGRAGVEHAAEKGVPVFIMEPLRGGLLVDRLPGEAKELIEKEEHGRSAAEWALKWLWDQTDVTMVLSGMNSVEMIDENVRVAENTPENSLTDGDFEFYEKLCKSINNSIKIGCTGCAYCMPCPFGVNIPACFRCYNSSYMDGYFHGIKEYFMITAFSKEPSYASVCRQCGKCLEHCPQSIPIPDMMKKVKRRLEVPGFKPARWFVKNKMMRPAD